MSLKPAPDGVRLLKQMRDTVEALFVRRAPVRQLLLTLELRVKLEEQVLLPALLDCGLPRSTMVTYERDWKAMRDLAAQAQVAHACAAREEAVLCALEGVATLHFAELDRLIERYRGELDREALGHDIQALLHRWQDELASTGDIEDEECDPVGLPPR